MGEAMNGDHNRTTGSQDATALPGRSATALAAMIRGGEISALECVDAHIARIEEVNPQLNAVVVKRYDAARAEARAIDEARAAGRDLPPLAGVPVTVKECLDLAGTPSTFGLVARKAAVAAEDSREVARLRAGGAVILGKTNVAQALLFVESDNPVYGRTANPHASDRTCGGSSGGEAAIIAAKGSALGLGTDIGGSVRNPATFCGIASIKPTAGRLPDTGTGSMPLGETAIMSQIGVMARSVDDVALGLRQLDGGRSQDEPVVPLGDIAAVDVARLRIGWYDEDGILPSSPAIKRAVREAAQALSTAGATVVPWQPPGIDEASELALAIFAADGGAFIKELVAGGPVHPTLKDLMRIAGLPRPLLKLLPGLLNVLGQPSLSAMTRAFGRTTAADCWRLNEQLADFKRRFAEAMARAEPGPLDLILGPACSLPAFPHGATKDLSVGGGHCLLYNVLGYPAGVVPMTIVRPNEQDSRPASRDVMLRAAARCDVGSAGLPVGVQIAAPPWREHVALAAMGALERRA